MLNNGILISFYQIEMNSTEEKKTANSLKIPYIIKNLVQIARRL